MTWGAALAEILVVTFFVASLVLNNRGSTGRGKKLQSRKIYITPVPQMTIINVRSLSSRTFPFMGMFD